MCGSAYYLWVVSTALAVHPSGALNFWVALGLLENSYTPGLTSHSGRLTVALSDPNFPLSQVFGPFRKVGNTRLITGHFEVLVPGGVRSG